MEDGSEVFAQSPDFKSVYADWQAIRIIRDNFFDSWKFFMTFFTWYWAGIAATISYILTNRPFVKPSDTHFVGALGVFGMTLALFFSVFMYFHSRRLIENINSILEKNGDTAHVGKITNMRSSKFMSTGMSISIFFGIFGWIYFIFFYYPR